jgi:hypothetical protein
LQEGIPKVTDHEHVNGDHINGKDDWICDTVLRIYSTTYLSNINPKRPVKDNFHAISKN